MAEQITIEQAKTTRQQRKRVLTTRINAMGRYMAEEFDVDNIKERREQLKKTFAEFVDAHQQVESLCTTEKELDECLGYITEAETGYISVLRQTSEYVARIRADSSSSFERPDSRYVGGLEAVNRFDNSAIHLPKLEIEVFDGDPMRYHSFIAVFEQSVEKYCTDGSARLTRLLQYTDGKAKQAIRACSIIGGADGYGRAREILHQRFGEKHIISKSMTEKLRTRKAVRTKEEVRELADELLSCVLTLKEMGRVQEIDTQNTITDIIERLPRYIQNRWRRHAVTQRREQGTYPDIKDLVQFVTDTADEVTDPVYGYSESDNKGFEKKHNRTYVADMTKYESSQPNVEKYQCRVCRGNHGIGECEKFKGMSVPNRWELAKEQRLCFRCLGRGHSGQRCARSQMCNLDGCRSSHHKLLHDSRREARSAQSSSEQAQPPQGNERPLGTYVSNSSMTPSFVSMRTIPVILCNRNRRVKVNALLDEASSRSYVNEDVIAELGLTGEFQQITVNVLGGVKEQLKTMEVEFDIESVDRKVRRKMSAFTTKRVTGGMEAIDWSVNKRQWTHLTDIPFPHIGQHATVDILIGLDQADLLYSMQDIRGGQGEPIARLTPLGWTCVGGPNWNSQMHHANYTYFANNLDNILQKYWDIDEPHTHSVLSPDQELANNMAAASIKFEKDHYIIGIPWKDKSALGDNRVMALHRLRGTEKRLKQTPDLRAAYSNIIERYEGAGYIRKVPVEENPQQAWYLPHFPVIRPDKSTTKTRLVFDASARHNDVSLNDVVFQGPKLQNELFDVLLRARRKPIMIMCDVQEMYLQVALKETDRPFHRFLWRDCDSQSEPTVYEFNRLVFGLNSSPFLAQYVIQHHAKMLQKEYPLGAETILKSTYMDDSMDSVDDSRTAAELYLQLSALWQSAGMHARKWMSNCPELLELIPTADCQGPVDLDKGEPYTVKTLGILWSPKEDQFHFQTTQPQENSHKTKRLFLKKIATLFDPLGFLASYTIKAKMLLQDMWTSGADWDDDLDDSLATKSRQWFDQLRELYQLRIPRCLRSDKEVKSIELHTFVDASQTCYEAVDASTFNPRKRWRRVQEIVRHFWKRWITEWIPSLNVRRKWPQGNRLYEKGDVVIVMSPDTPRGRWPLGRIENCYPGRDGIVRVVDVKVGNTVLRRPIVKLCLLEAPDAK